MLGEVNNPLFITKAKKVFILVLYYKLNITHIFISQLINNY